MLATARPSFYYTIVYVLVDISMGMLAVKLHQQNFQLFTLGGG